MVAQALPVPSRFPFHPDETRTRASPPAAAGGSPWHVGDARLKTPAGLGPLGLPVRKTCFPVKYPCFIKKEVLFLNTPQQSPEMSPRAARLQVGYGEGEPGGGQGSVRMHTGVWHIENVWGV